MASRAAVETLKTYGMPVGKRRLHEMQASIDQLLILGISKWRLLFLMKECRTFLI